MGCCLLKRSEKTRGTSRCWKVAAALPWALIFSMVPLAVASGLAQDSVSGKAGLLAGATESGVDVSTGAADLLQSWQGKRVSRILFEGVAQSRLAPLPSQLPQRAGEPLDGERVRQSLRRLYATGLYDTIEANGSLSSGDAGDAVELTFRGEPRVFIGVVTVEGAKGANTNALLVRASRLTPGTRFQEVAVAQAETAMKKALSSYGFHDATVSHRLNRQPDDALVDISFTVASGQQARTGKVSVSGDSGLTVEEFRHYAHLRPGHLVDQETTGQALNGVVNHYRKQQRLEAEVRLESRAYNAGSRLEDFHFTANRGPIVDILVDGAKLSDGRVRKLVPVYEEGTVDEDLLNEGNRRLQNYFQRLGYFDVVVRHEQKPAKGMETVEILYHVQLGARHTVGSVTILGNRYFGLPTLQERLRVRAHDAFDRQGVYNQSLVAADVASIQAVYQNNGFSSVKVTPEIDDADRQGKSPEGKKQVPLNVIYHIEEGAQRRVRSVELMGAEKVDKAPLEAMLNTAVGQPLSPESLVGDRETLLTYYLSRGFDQATVEVAQAPVTDEAMVREPVPGSAKVDEKAAKTEAGSAGGDRNIDADKVDVIFRIHEGTQVFLRRVLITGLHYTRPETVAHGITLHEGQPLDQTALLDTQRNLYDLAVFNEVNPVIQNPTGQELNKTVLLQLTEARRWDFSYGLGFEVQTGTVNGSTQSSPNGATGASPRVLLELSRINLFGREQTASVRGTYGLLEQRINLLYQYPRFHGSRNFGLSFSGGYNNSQDVTTYSASKLEGSLRLTEHFYGEGQWLSKANTFLYQFIFRRVKVNESSIQVPLNEIPLLSQAVRVGGPSFTWIRDTRDAPLDAHRGTYTSFQEFLSAGVFGSEADFNQVDVSNSSYYQFGLGRLVVARNTRYGQERAYGPANSELIPLPERLYGGGGSSHRGFGINSAGPRDPQTGFPIGGAGAFINSTELRMPPPTLPFVGKTISFVLFHDMGNIFTNASDIWPSIFRFRQQNRAGCRNLSTTVTGPVTSTGQQGTCTFNYFSHALGLGLRYQTPVGPIRVDFSSNLNPPIYPVTYDTVAKKNLVHPYVGEGPHFNFFFSLGQSF